MARRSQGRPDVHLEVPVADFRRSSADAVYQALHEAILARELQGGTPLIEAHLAEMLRVSKTPVREALQRLAHDGLVDFTPGRGATVHTLTPEEMRDVMELRLALEPLALRQSAPRLSPDDFRELDALIARAKKALGEGDYVRLGVLNRRFHDRLNSGCGNRRLLAWLAGLSDTSRLIAMKIWEDTNRSHEEFREHQGIVEALEEGRHELAVKRLQRHVERFHQLVLAYGSHRGEDDPAGR